MKSRTIRVDYLARVEGEGALHVKVKNGAVEDVRLEIFEPPRFFEALLRGRDFTEAPDITARICGICPIAYLLGASKAMEDACGVEVGVPLNLLRRLIYCGEWIESHALHLFMLYAPDFLGYQDAVQMARDHSDVVRRGLRLKKIGPTRSCDGGASRPSATTTRASPARPTFSSWRWTDREHRAPHRRHRLGQSAASRRRGRVGGGPASGGARSAGGRSPHSRRRPRAARCLGRGGRCGGRGRRLFGSPPGTISRFDAGTRPLPRHLVANCSTHDLGLGDAIEVARALDRLPDRVIVIGVEGSDFSRGHGLSRAVAGAVEGVVEAVSKEPARLAAPGLRRGEAEHA